jgi:hypothetical protein
MRLGYEVQEMELHQIRKFIAAAEELSVTKAAQRMHVSQPALSRQIASLEDELVCRDISLWTGSGKINANRDCTLGLLMVSPAQRVGAYV